MRVKVTLSHEAAELLKRARLPAAAIAGAVLLLGAYGLGASAHPDSGQTAQAVSQTEPQTPPAAEPEPVRVPSSAGGARSSGMGGQTWMSGDPSALGAQFKRSIAHQFSEGSLGQARLAMVTMGFDCSVGSGGGMVCKKAMQADNCTLTWSVRIEARGSDVLGAGGEGFSRECS